MFTKRKNLVGIVLFVTVWILILVIPRTRLLLKAQLSRDISPPTDEWDFDTDFSFPSPTEIPALRALVQKYPNDPKVQSVFAQCLQINRSTSPQDRLRKLDALIQRFPNDIALIQTRARQSTNGGFHYPSGSYTTGFDGKRSYMHGQNWLSTAQLKQTLKIMHLGEMKEPNNSFYNWVEAACWYGLDENDKALEALQSGSRKTSYEDGSLQNTKARLYVQSLMKQPLLEDRFKVVASEILPQYARVRATTRAAIWQGAMQERAGNHARALDIYGAQLRMSALMLRNSKLPIGRLVARAMLDITWLAQERKKLSDEEIDYMKDTPKTAALFLNHAQRFADYANAHGRGDLAQESLSVARSVIADPLYGNHYRAGYTFLSRYQLQQLGSLKWTGIFLLRFTIISIIFGICLALLLALFDRLATERTAARQIPLRYSNTIICAIFILFCAGAFVGIYLSQIPQKDILYLLMMAPESSEMIIQVGGIDSALNFVLGWVPWMSLILLFMYCLLPSWWKMRKSTFGGRKGLADSILVILGKIPLTFLLLVLQTILVFWILSLVSKVTDSALVEYCIFITIPIPCILFLFYLWRKEHQQTSPPQFSAAAYWIYSFRMLRNSLALLIVVCSLVYGATSFASLPLRNQANASLDRYLKVGPVDFLRQALEQNKAEYTEANTTE